MANFNLPDSFKENSFDIIGIDAAEPWRNPEAIFLTRTENVPAGNHTTTCFPGMKTVCFKKFYQTISSIIVALAMQIPLQATLYALPFVVASVLSTQEASGQDFLPPKGNINVFTSKDTTIKSQEYNSLTTKEKRNSIIDERLKEDFTNTIYGRGPPEYPYIWNCNQSTLQLIVNSHDWGKEDTYYGGTLFYSGYDGSEKDITQLYANSGTTKDMGKLGLPTYSLDIYDEKTRPEGHGMNAIITGDTLTNWNAWNIIEPQYGATNVKPGEYYFPKNCKHAEIYYNYLFKDKNHKKNFGQIKILEFEIIEGIATLTYNINNDTKTVYNADNLDVDPRMFIPLNERVHLFETRQDAITGIEEIIKKETLKIYPNPATNYITIETPNNNYNKIKTEIYSVDDKLIKTEQTENKEKINVETLKTGVYVVKTTDGKNIYTNKLVKRYRLIEIIGELL
jgi:hypothetical protein